MSNKPSAKVLSASNKENSQLCEKEQLESELKLVHQKLKDKEVYINKLENEVEHLNETIKSLKQENEQISSCQNLAEKQKLIAIASCIFNNFGTSSDVASLVLKNSNSDDDVVCFN